MSPTPTGVGRLRTTPSEPSSSWSRSSTTARSKFGSARAGVATSSRPVSEDTSVMPDMIPHLRPRAGSASGASVSRAQLRAHGSDGTRAAGANGRTVTLRTRVGERSVLCRIHDVSTAARRPYGQGGAVGPYPFRLAPCPTPLRNARSMTGTRRCTACPRRHPAGGRDPRPRREEPRAQGHGRRAARQRAEPAAQRARHPRRAGRARTAAAARRDGPPRRRAGRAGARPDARGERERRRHRRPRGLVAHPDPVLRPAAAPARPRLHPGPRRLRHRRPADRLPLRGAAPVRRDDREAGGRPVPGGPAAAARHARSGCRTRRSARPSRCC